MTKHFLYLLICSIVSSVLYGQENIDTLENVADGQKSRLIEVGAVGVVDVPAPVGEAGHEIGPHFE